MLIWEALLLGLIQGFAEFLPISSSGHLALVQNFLNYDAESALAFTVLLHLGTLAAVFIAFYKDIWALIKGFFSLVSRLFNKNKGKLSFDERLFVMLLIATVPLVPAAILSDYVESLSSISWLIGVFLLINGVMLLISDTLSRADTTLETAKPKNALFVGLFQLAGVLPGISRSGSTITGGLFNGFERKDAVRFSFLLSIPAILGANILKAKDVIERFNEVGLTPMIVGAVTALIAGLAAIKLLQYIATNKTFRPFAYYCFAAGAVAVIIDLFIL